MPRLAQPMPAELPTLIYDGECGFCKRSMELVRRWDREHRLRYVPFQDEAAVARFGVALPALAAAMHVVLPDGRVYAEPRDRGLVLKRHIAQAKIGRAHV